MDHVAILSKKRDLLRRIISGEKTIESRWYKSRKTPYHSISEGDTIYFKDSGDPVTVKARISQAMFFEGLDDDRIVKILEKYGEKICIPVSYAPQLSGKKYCTLVFLTGVTMIKPFEIDKTGFGMMAAWITVHNIDKIKK
ncbi:MAG: hypothetical protein AABX47_05780 [Nanoarchaeota archaeon]